MYKNVKLYAFAFYISKKEENISLNNGSWYSFKKFVVNVCKEP